MAKYAKRKFMLMMTLAFTAFLAKWGLVIGLAWAAYNYFIK